MARTPSVLEDPTPTDEIVARVHRAIANKRFTVGFQIQPDGTVRHCTVETVSGRRDLQDLISEELRVELCAAIERRRYTPVPSLVEAHLAFDPPQLR